jgi:peroxiredoxin (alkyl hydroperoxide reductase subunit C)
MAPDFTALSTQGPITLSQYRGKWVILQSEPGNFNATSTSAVVGASLYNNEVVKRNAQTLIVTIDNVFSNNELVKDIYDTFGILVPFPIIEDRDTTISRKYGIVNPDRVYEESVRDLFFINPKGKIRAILTYPIAIGRSGSEILRILDALQINEAYNVYTPTDWVPGDPVIIPTSTVFSEGFLRSQKLGTNCKPWYSCYVDYNTLINYGKKIPN